MEKELTVGIKVNGSKLDLRILKEDSNKSDFDYICNVGLLFEEKGNGSYTVTVLGKNNSLGMFLKGWRFNNGLVSYNWGQSDSSFKLIDNSGNETERIFVSKQRGSISGFDLLLHTVTLFKKYESIIKEYPSSAEIYNAIASLNKSKENFEHWWCYNKEKDEKEKLPYFIENTLNHLMTYTEKFKTAKKLLEECKDPRAQNLLTKITNECQEMLSVTNEGLAIITNQ
jgi:hypothetical protein